MPLLVKLGKQGKALAKRVLTPAEPKYLRYARRLEQVKTGRRICAMTFDDGPMDLPAAPDRFDGRALTDVLLDVLGEHGAKGTFDVIGSTEENYPDRAGKLGSPAWGGVRFDHYPDLGQDRRGGAANNERLIRRIVEEGHQITNHGYRHVIFGRKPFVYGKRVFLGNFEEALEDVSRLDRLLRDRYGYEMHLGRPAHYVDRIGGGFTSYDVYEALGYQYLAAAFDGAGWLPAADSDPEAALRSEVEAMLAPMRASLEKDADFFCGKIIFQKDGYNMAKRTPIAFALGEQLKLLARYGYRVVTVDELRSESPFADLGREDPLFEKLEGMQRERAIVYADNSLRLDGPMTQGELAMLLAPREEALERRRRRMRETGKKEHPYWGAMDYCRERGWIPNEAKPEDPVRELPGEFFAPGGDRKSRRGVYAAWRGEEGD